MQNLSLDFGTRLHKGKTQEDNRFLDTKQDEVLSCTSSLSGQPSPSLHLHSSLSNQIQIWHHVPPSKPSFSLYNF